MLGSSLYVLSDFLDDRGEVVVNRVKQYANMKLITVAQDFALHDRLERLGLSDTQSLNMYDWLQGSLDYPDRGIDNDMRVLHRYDKRDVVLSPVDVDGKSVTDVKSQGTRVASISFAPNRVAHTKDVTFYNQDQIVWAKDYYDIRGFLSRRQYFNPDGKLGMELIYHVDGSPVLEISHMGDKIMYRLLGTHGLPNLLFNNELSLMLWCAKKWCNTESLVYNDDPFLDSVWSQVGNPLKWYEISHVQNLTPQRLEWLKNLNKDVQNVIAVNPIIAEKYGFKYVAPWVSGQMVKAKDKYSPIRVASFGAWIHDTVVTQLVDQIAAIVNLMPQVRVHLVGYFSGSSEKTYHSLLKQYNLEDYVVMHGNVVGPQRKQILQNCAIAWWLPLGDESYVKPYILNHYGLPVITTIEGFRGAVIKEHTPSLIAQALKMGLEDISAWRNDVEKYPM